MNILFLRGMSLEKGRHETLRLHVVEADVHVDANIDVKTTCCGG